MREKGDDGWTNIGSPDLFREQKFRGGYLETRRHGSFNLSGFKKQYAGVVAKFIGALTTRRFTEYGICLAGMHKDTWKWRFGCGFAASME